MRYFGSDSHALEVVGRTKDLEQIRTEIAAQTVKAREARRVRACP
jgi:hypothetical protein